MTEENANNPVPAPATATDRDPSLGNSDVPTQRAVVEPPKRSRVKVFLLIGLGIAVLVAGLTVLIIYLTSPSLLQPGRPFVMVQDTNNGPVMAKVDLQAGLAIYEPYSKGRLLSDSETDSKSYTVHELYVGKTYNVTLENEDVPMCIETSVEPVNPDATETPVEAGIAQPLETPLVSGPSKDVVEKELKGDKKVILLKYYRPIRKFFIRERPLDNKTFSSEVELLCLAVNEGAKKGAEGSGNQTVPDPPKRLLFNYGHYCGIDNRDDTNQKIPIDRVDRACQEHDRCAVGNVHRGTCGYRGERTPFLPCHCQSSFVSSLTQVLASWPTFGERVAAWPLIRIFSTIPCGCRIGFRYCFWYVRVSCSCRRWRCSCRASFSSYCFYVSFEACLAFPQCYTVGTST